MYCNDVDISLTANRYKKRGNSNLSKGSNNEGKARYKIICHIEENEHDDNMPEDVDIEIDWGGQSKTPFKSYPTHLLKLVASRLFIGSANIGGKIDRNSVVLGLTEININGQIYRTHP